MLESASNSEYPAQDPVPVAQIKYAGFWIRVGATFVDMLVLSPLMFLNFYNTIKTKSILLMLIIFFLSNLYKPILEFKKGGTLGKLFLNIKVVNEDFESISLNQSFIRYSPWLVLFVFGLISNIYVYAHPTFSEISSYEEVAILTSNAPLFSFLSIYNWIFIVSIVKVAFSKTKRALHDDIAKTCCIKF